MRALFTIGCESDGRLWGGVVGLSACAAQATRDMGQGAGALAGTAARGCFPASPAGGVWPGFPRVAAGCRASSPQGAWSGRDAHPGRCGRQGRPQLLKDRHAVNCCGGRTSALPPSRGQLSGLRTAVPATAQGRYADPGRSLAPSVLSPSSAADHAGSTCLRPDCGRGFAAWINQAPVGGSTSSSGVPSRASRI